MKIIESPTFGEAMAGADAHGYIVNDSVSAVWMPHWGSPIMLPNDISYEMAESEVNITDQPEEITVSWDDREITVFVYEVQ